MILDTKLRKCFLFFEKFFLKKELNHERYKYQVSKRVFPIEQTFKHHNNAGKSKILRKFITHYDKIKIITILLKIMLRF